MRKQLVIVGGGPAATHAAETIRKFHSDARLTMICDEPPHSRMALPYWLAGKIPREQMYTGSAEMSRQRDITWMADVRAVRLDENKRQLTLSDDHVIPFDDLLIATGSRPQALPIPGADLPGVLNLWTLADAQRLLDAAETHDRPRVVLVGAGFIGLIVLNALHQRRWPLTVVERESRPLPRMLPPDAATMVQQWLLRQEVAWHGSSEVREITQDADGSKRIVLTDETDIPADLVIVATGVRPRLDLVQSTSIQTDEGILVDHRMRTNVEGVFAAGDVAQGPVLDSDELQVHAIQPTAVDHGRIAGANMAGQAVAYAGSLSMNVLDVCGLQCCSFGRWNDPSTEVMAIGNPGSSIYRSLHWNGDQLVGAVLVGRAQDLGMLTDVGMVKGLIQSGARLGPWKEHLRTFPFDIRRAYVASGVAHHLTKSTLLGQATSDRHYRFDSRSVKHEPSSAHRRFFHSST